MLTPEELDRICIVLVRARNPNNIGAAARAMHDFGLHHLRVVNDYAIPFESARAAVDATQVLADAVACASVAEAIADCTLVVGTTAVGKRDLQHPLYTLPLAAPRIRAELRRSSGVPGCIALLFGSEKTGLSNEELSHCKWLLTIPMQQKYGERHLSMNLGQAVAVCLYELVRDGTVDKCAQDSAAPASAADLERLTTLLYETLEKSGYMRRHPANSDLLQLRQMLRRITLNDADAAIWMGIFRQLLFRLRHCN